MIKNYLKFVINKHIKNHFLLFLAALGFYFLDFAGFGLSSCDSIILVYLIIFTVLAFFLGPLDKKPYNPNAISTKKKNIIAE